MGNKVDINGLLCRNKWNMKGFRAEDLQRWRRAVWRSREQGNGLMRDTAARGKARKGGMARLKGLLWGSAKVNSD